MSPTCEEDLEQRRVMDAKYSRKYHRKSVVSNPTHSFFLTVMVDRNQDERNAKTCLRMARLRNQDHLVPPEELEVRLAARREASRKYRERCEVAFCHLLH